MKFDSARGIDQGDLTRMLGSRSDDEIEPIIAVVERYSGDPAAGDEIRQYAQIGRWERGIENNETAVDDETSGRT